jgi:hypothetical protein
MQENGVTALQKNIFLPRAHPKNCVVRKQSPTGGGKGVAFRLQPSQNRSRCD